MYANKSRSRMMNLRDKLNRPKGTISITKYFQSLHSIADELALIDSPVSDDDLVIHALHGIDSEFEKIVSAIKNAVLTSVCQIS